MENENKDLHNQDDVNPTSQLDKIIVEGADEDVNTNGTGSNRPVPTSGTVIIKETDGNDENQD
jgi:hypothetical protein